MEFLIDCCRNCRVLFSCRGFCTFSFLHQLRSGEEPPDIGRVTSILNYRIHISLRDGATDGKSYVQVHVLRSSVVDKELQVFCLSIGKTIFSLFRPARGSWWNSCPSCIGLSHSLSLSILFANSMRTPGIGSKRIALKDTRPFFPSGCVKVLRSYRRNNNIEPRSQPGPVSEYVQVDDDGDCGALRDIWD